MNYSLKKLCSIALTSIMLMSFTSCTNTNPNQTSRDTTPMVETANLVAPGDPTNIPENLNIDWNKRYTFIDLEAQLFEMALYKENITKLYSIGSSWQERELWCLEITDKEIAEENKIGIGVFANIHGGERESASSAMYTAWWTILNSEDPYIKDMLKKYIIYIVPVINPDGYEQSFINNNRPNLRPTDLNNNKIPFSDPYTDIDSDGYVATLYRGIAQEQPTIKTGVKFGMESPDWDKNGKLGDDPRTSTIDLNRTFDYQWNRYDIETSEEGNSVVGNNSWRASGANAASEPEIKAISNFMAEKPMSALATMHTGIQCVLYPWCYREYDTANPKDAQIPFMKETAVKMAEAFSDTTGRGCYTMSSWEDYPTSAEMIDYAFGRFNIHAYTIEVYRGGKSKDGDKAECTWENTLPTEKWVFYSQDDIKNKLGLDPMVISDAADKTLEAGEGLWFYTSSTAQMVDKAPEDQITMVKGAKDAVVVMIESETDNSIYKKPFYVR